MALGNIGNPRQTTYLNIKDGKIYARTPDKAVTTYNYVDGVIKRIGVVDRKTATGAPFKDWVISMEDPDTGDAYTLAIGYRSGVMISIVLSLASDLENVYKRVRIEPYMKGQYTNVAVYLDGVRLDWVTRDLPPVTYHDIAGQKVKDDAARLQFVAEWVDRINRRLLQQESIAARIPTRSTRSNQDERI